MFERFTEKARRVLFFARHEATRFGSPQIQTEHLLLGLLREDRALASQFLRRDAPETMRTQMEARLAAQQMPPATVDLPFSNASRRVLAYASEEAERLGHRHIGTEHLLLGLLREEKSLAAELLREWGASIREVRRQLAAAHPPAAPASPGSMHLAAAGVPTVSLLADSGSSIEEIARIAWQTSGFRLPLAGETLEIERDGQIRQYRVVEVIWQIAATGELPVQATNVVLKLQPQIVPAG